ncbi:hypothetical protein TD95_002741 [Thielaviopsis punctulata]|uniref:Transglutaminase-like domain-containing protein n=1 Tax=Thielaviopsis punctulata TaxID=72032 RepID=A0A0F4ZKV9_9PEZI|nr:hypothetical protein TD95_002741 [Thielaviopsis punctulata]
MSDVEEPRFSSLADRIKALNQQKNFATTTAPHPHPPPPPPPPTAPTAPTAPPSSNTRNPRPPPPPPPSQNPNSLVKNSSAQNAPSVASPPLPSRPSPSARPPPLPQRALTSTTTTGNSILPPPPPSKPLLPTRHPSSSSLRSQYSTASSIESTTGAARKLPPTFDPATLPPTIESRPTRSLSNKTSITSLSSVGQKRVLPPPKPSLPPRRPTDPVSASTVASTAIPTAASTASSFPATAPALPTRRLPPPPPPQTRPQPVSTASAPPQLPTRPKAQPVAERAVEKAVNETTAETTSEKPPPIPLASKPSLATVTATIQRAAAPPCLYCRDFSAPDRIAAQYPRESVPRDDPIGYLAHVLCNPFPSATDKARAIFTWHHHNIDYDWAAFSSGCVRPATAEDVVFSGKGVCAGYAGLYAAIAQRAGLQCIIVAGHGKGIGYTDIEANQSLPRQDATGHAWNAVQIDHGHWKLVDACWGAGNCSNNQYNRHFSPHEFAAPNEVFGMRHFPQDPAHFLRSDGRTPSWAEYLRGPAGGPGPTLCGRFGEEGLAPLSVGPAGRDIQVSETETIRVQVSRACGHGTREKAALVIRVAGKWVAMQTDGFWWWLDVYARDLGEAGETVMLAVPNEINGQAVKGVTVEEYEKGFRSVGFDGLVMWRLV